MTAPKTVNRVLFAIYLLVLAVLTLAPFLPVEGLRGEPTKVEWKDGAVWLREGAALEVRDGVSEMRQALMASGRMSLEVLLQTDSLGQAGPARIVTYSRHAMGRNFTMGQNGNGIEFRLRTTEAKHNGQYQNLLVPQVLDDHRIQHLLLVFDGSRIRLYVDGKPHSTSRELGGDFSNWERCNALVLGDEVPGGRFWEGRLYRLAIFNRALDATEAAQLFARNPVSGAILEYDFGRMEKPSQRKGLRQHRYRNLFIWSGAAFTWFDCIANISVFIPLAALAYLVFPVSVKQRKWLAVLVLPMVIGLSASMAIELCQRLVHYRVPSLLDLGYNGLGTLIGCVLVALVDRFKQRRKKHEDHYCR